MADGKKLSVVVMTNLKILEAPKERSSIELTRGDMKISNFHDSASFAPCADNDACL